MRKLLLYKIEVKLLEDKSTGERNGDRMERTVYLLLENGKYFEGKGFGASLDEVTGELVFTTGMTGYLETITDPSYYGQIVVQTFPMIGNYGVIPQDFENKEVYLSAYIVKEWCQDPSNFRSSGNLDTFFKERKVPAIYGIDTRKLAKTIREYGSMNGRLTVKKPPYGPEELEQIRNFRITSAVESVTPAGCHLIKTNGKADYRVVLWDFGAKENILRELTKRGCDVYDATASTTADEILALDPDGIMLSNGPGNPEDNARVIEELKKLAVAKRPIFGICLGHQLLAIARGAKTGKMKYGHRGANQPVKDLETIIETMIETISEAGVPVRDFDGIIEQIRIALKRTITRLYCEDGSMKVITLDTELERTMAGSVQKGESGMYLALQPDILQSLISQLAEQMKKFNGLTQNPVILTSQVMRIHFYHLIEQFYPKVRVLSFNEIANNVQIQSIGSLRLEETRNHM